MRTVVRIPSRKLLAPQQELVSLPAALVRRLRAFVEAGTSGTIVLTFVDGRLDRWDQDERGITFQLGTRSVHITERGQLILEAGEQTEIAPPTKCLEPEPERREG